MLDTRDTLSDDQSTVAYVALYRRDVPVAGTRPSLAKSFHWALALTKASKSIADGAYVYQINNPRTGAWEHCVPAQPLSPIEQSSNFVVAIRLGACKMSIEHVRQFCASYPATPDDGISYEWHKEWSCAMWLITLLGDLAFACDVDGIGAAILKSPRYYGRITPVNADQNRIFYDNIYHIGYRVTGSNSANSLVRYVGGVEVVEYADHLRWMSDG
ncbi:hypothetical protein FISHEDRAFT_70842 [Fistulina hepatica ATCC 64428]|uniref:Uncharacterized protein n=1 Tax=Fistulina hepatica ATCC 64428 TaxID=1128425 RepID=A0A0D7AHI0_9AGAR|nr:hypothetical protein FISHEDRAFT_70842 [Fistulina hepatica ATCC 64428]